MNSAQTGMMRANVAAALGLVAWLPSRLVRRHRWGDGG
jgi:hypothetical protein